MRIMIEDEGVTFRKCDTEDWFTLEMEEFGMVMSTRDKFLEGMDLSYSVAMLANADAETWKEKMDRYNDIRNRVEALL